MEILPVDVEGLIPHGKSIRLVDRLMSVGQERSRSEYRVSKESPLVDDSGRLDELAYVEMMAQSAAAGRGFQLNAEERRDHIGMLLGVREMVITGEARVGNCLTVDVHVIARLGECAVVEGEVRHADGRLIAAGELKIWSGSRKKSP